MVRQRASVMLVLSLISAWAMALPAYAESKQAAMVLDANTGRVLHEQFADQPRKPASLTKMMTLYMAFSEIEAGRLSYSTKIPVSARAASMAPSKLGLKAGEEIRLIDAMKALITKSANDMAVAVAEKIGGTEANFAKLMTTRARQIGMRSTRFRNASGLPDSRQISTARDMVTLGLRLQEDFPQHYKLFSIKSFDYKGKTYRTHNTLMHGFPGMDGIKTGYTRASGFNLVSSVKADGKHVVAAVFGGTTAATRNAHMRILLYRGLEAASAVKTRQPQPMLVAKPAPVTPRKQDPKASVETAWKAETIRAPAPKPVSKPTAKPSKAAAKPTPPAPAGAVRRPGDQIGAVLARAEEDRQRAASRPSQMDTVVATADGPAQQSVALAAPRLDLGALREAISTRDEGEASATEEPTGIAALIAMMPIEPESAGSGAAPAPVETGEVARPPSTLAEQAQRLAGQDTSTQGEAAAQEQTFAQASTNPLAVIAAAQPTPAANAAFEIQIGAFASAVEAETKLSIARTRVPVLNQHEGILLPVQKGERRIFRARFLRFDERGAANACSELRRAAIDCFVMKSA